MPEASIEICDHPVFGRMVNDQWDSDWTCLREFPAFASLCWAESAAGPRGTRKEVKVTERVSHWREQEPQLVRDQHFPVLAQLHHLGVFEVGVEIGAVQRDPAGYQVEAYRRFLDSEESCSARILDALWRYYLDLTSGRCAYMFGDGAGQFRLLSSPDELPAQVEFSRLSVPRCHADGEAPLDFSFATVCDSEHGFHIVFHQSQVIGIGCWDDMQELTRRPATYSGSQEWMTPPELAGLASYTQAFLNGDRQHDS